MIGAVDDPGTPQPPTAAWTRHLTADGVRPVAWPAGSEIPGTGTLWLHLDRTDPSVRHWLETESGIHPLFTEALLEPDPRPRCVRDGEALLLILRTANLNPGAEPEDLISIRIWAEPGRIVVLRNRACPAIDRLQERFCSGAPPATTSTAFALLVKILVDALEPVLDDIDESMDMIEERLVLNPDAAQVHELGAPRRQVLLLHRYLAPQRDVLAHLEANPPEWISDADARSLADLARLGNRNLEDLQAARDHGTLLQEELSARLSEHLNRRLYLFTVVASIFIPLTFFTGLLGANVDGIPGADRPWAFAAICVLSAAIAVGQYWYFRWRSLI